MKKVIFSGIQPSGNLHIGNYVGAIAQWVKLQNESEAFFCIVDLHAITVPQDPETLREKVLDTAALYIACGIDPKKAHIFVQSENPDHPYLAWLLNCITPFGQLERMTQFKDKSKKQQEGTNAGLFDYPVLMAADILLYQTDEVPVGEDQKQHIEITRDLAEKFNRDFGQTVKVPEALIQNETSRIMSLQNPTSKMSKSDNDPMGTINLLDGVEIVSEKVAKAVTDSGTEIVKREDKLAISNLLTIHSVFSESSIQEIEKEYKGKSYAEFKKGLADLLNKKLDPIREKYNSIREDVKFLRQILDEGASYARSKSSKTLREVRVKMGLG
ncbi:MAG: tryptophan--tRNA ligase [Candidatus Levybacteria bacterium RIFCSPLOWO2_01_FULL_38_13]|nr:MAG: tryptophan--tRNA ligase [Candidatus Levybacteria bacterium RIFCSPHIGHO2_01_FULL_41_15]OGH34640.1 MAG: tryptophan--tRNA ligase [Candidatus Levybacteria bacterium RIFCSPLOWO2_01_FULL_38_13]